jgi:hypothetical protein
MTKLAPHRREPPTQTDCAAPPAARAFPETAAAPNRRESSPLTEHAVHPAATVFPEMAAADLQALADDIKQNGLVHPIVRTPDGVVIDGRNRLKACAIAGVEPRFEVYDASDPVGFIVSSNLKRRQLNESQRALIATRLATLGRGQRTAFASEPSLSDDQMRKFADLDSMMSQAVAAAALNVSKRSVQSARVVLERGTPELVTKVEQGLVAVSTAARTLKPSKPRRASSGKKTKSSIDISSIQSAFRHVEKSAASGNVSVLRKCLGELRSAVEEALL